MALKDLFFSIFAKDETAAGFNGVKQNIERVEGAAVKMSERLDRSGKSILKLAAAGAAISGGLVAAFRGSGAAASAQEKAERRVALAIRASGAAAGVTAEQLGRQARALSELTGFGDQDILGSVTAQMLSFSQITGDVLVDANRLAVDLAAGMGSDLSAAAGVLGQALSDPARGLDSLAAAGLRFTDAQRAQVSAMQDAGNMAGAQRVILDQLGAAYAGQGAQARASAEGARNAWSATFTDLREVVGGITNEVVAPVFNGLTRLARAFMGLPGPVRTTAVAIGIVAAAVPPLVVSVAGLAVAVNALTGPVGLAVGALSALAAGAALLWPQTDRAADAANDLTRAMGDEITQSQLLNQALKSGVVMSVNVANAKLQEARARYDNVKAAIAEQRVLAQSTAAFISLENELTNAGTVLADLESRPNENGAVTPLIEQANVWRDSLIDRRNEMTKTAAEMTAALDRERDNIEKLEAGLASANGAMVAFGGAVVEPIQPAERLERALGGGGGGGAPSASSGGVSGALAGVRDAAVVATDALDELHDTPVWDSLKTNMRGLIDGSQKFGDTWRNILGDALDRIFDLAFSPAWDRLFDNLQTQAGFSSGVVGGGGAGFGGILGGIAGAFKNLVGFDTGGSFTVRGRAGSDRNVAAVRLSEGERVEVLRRGQGSGGGRPVVVNIQTPDPSAFAASRAQIARQIGAAVALADRSA